MGALAADTGVWQLRTALPLRSTGQAPHWPIPQPYFVPFSFRTSRITHNRGMSAGTSTVVDRPFTVSWKAMTAVSYLLIFTSYHTWFSRGPRATIQPSALPVSYRLHCTLYTHPRARI